MSPFLVTFLARLFGAGAVIALGAVTARTLGREARGVVETLVVLRLALHAVASLGASQASTWVVARAPAALAPTARAGLGLGLLAGAAAGAGITAAAALHPAWFAPLPVGWVVVFAASAPAVLATWIAGGALLGAHRVHAWNLVAVAHRASMIALLAALAVPALRRVETVVAALVAAEAVALGVTLAALPAGGRVPAPRAAAAPPEVRRYAASAWSHAALSFALLRGDVLLLAALAGNDELGLYAAASLAREILLFLPWIAGLLFFPRVASATLDASGVRARPRAMGPAAVAVVGGAAALLFAFPRAFVVGVHGDRFADAAILVRILVPAALLTGVANLSLQELLGRGAPRATWLAPGAAVVTGLGLDLALIPRHGALGASWAALAASAVLCGVALAGRACARRPITPPAEGRPTRATGAPPPGRGAADADGAGSRPRGTP